MPGCALAESPWRSWLLLWSLGAACGCGRIEDNFGVWRASAFGVLSSGAAKAIEQSPQRFLVLNVTAEDSTLTFITAGQSGEAVSIQDVVGRTEQVSRKVVGQVLVNPADLSRTTGVISADRMEFRIRRVTVDGPSTLAGLTQPGSRAKLSVSGELTYDDLTRPTDVELIVEADITDGQLNGMQVSTGRPLPLLLDADAEQAAANGSAARTPNSARPTSVTFDLLARPSAPSPFAPRGSVE